MIPVKIIQDWIQGVLADRPTYIHPYILTYQHMYEMRGHRPTDRPTDMKGFDELLWHVHPPHFRRLANLGNSSPRFACSTKVCHSSPGRDFGIQYLGCVFLCF